jgi:hypothetical protein
MEKDIEEKTVNEYSPIEHPYSQRIDKANEYREHDKALDQSPDFLKIEQEVEKEVFTQFALDGIARLKYDLANGGKDEESVYDDEFDAPTEYDIYLRKKSNRIKEAKRLLEMYPDKPENAARLFMQIGSCHWIWVEKKRILKEKYGIIWYAPSEVNPDCIFD